MPFSYESLFSSYVFAKKALSYKKRTLKTLMKLIQGRHAFLSVVFMLTLYTLRSMSTEIDLGLNVDIAMLNL